MDTHNNLPKRHGERNDLAELNIYPSSQLDHIRCLEPSHIDEMFAVPHVRNADDDRQPSGASAPSRTVLNLRQYRSIQPV